MRRPNDGTDKQADVQTDGRTHDSFIDPSPHTMQAVSVIIPGIMYTGLRR